jgi:hypothetical protein
MDIVISRYKNNMTWISYFKTSRLFIYDKSGETNEYIHLPNIGRESHTYLTHIVNNYNDLANHVCFLQGNPFDHINIDVSTIETFSPLEDFFPLDSIMAKCDVYGSPHSWCDMKGLIFDKYFINRPSEIIFTPGACFIVKKTAILNRKIEFYQELLKEFDRTDIPNPSGINKMPWALERTWRYIFDKTYKTKYDN